MERKQGRHLSLGYRFAFKSLGKPLYIRHDRATDDQNMGEKFGARILTVGGQDRKLVHHRFTDVEPGSVADHLGIRNADELCKIDDQDVKTFTHKDLIGMFMKRHSTIKLVKLMGNNPIANVCIRLKTHIDDDSGQTTYKACVSDKSKRNYLHVTQTGNVCVKNEAQWFDIKAESNKMMFLIANTDNSNKCKYLGYAGNGRGTLCVTERIVLFDAFDIEKGSDLTNDMHVWYKRSTRKRSRSPSQDSASSSNKIRRIM